MGLTAEQQAIRALGVGSSDIAAILGEDDFKSPLDVWLLKTGRAEDAGNLFTRMGARAEDMVAEEFELRHGVTLERCTTIVHPEHPIAIATPDRLVVGTEPPEIVECKNVGYRMLPRWRADGQTYRAPAYVLIQGHWQCGVYGATAFHPAAWLGGRDYYDDRVEFDRELFEDMLTFAERWWRDHVVADRQPAPGDTERARAALERLFPRAVQAIQPAPDEVTRLALEYALTSATIRDKQRKRIAIGNQLCTLIGDAQGFIGEWGQVTWIAPKKGKTSWAAVAKELGAPAEVIARHTKAPARVLKVKVSGLEEDEDNE